MSADDVEGSDTITFAMLAVSLGVPMVLVVYVRVNRIGPRVLWASDACPAPNEMCGMIPAIVPIAALLGGLIAVVFGFAIQLAKNRKRQETNA